jgi:hypothetical protein
LFNDHHKNAKKLTKTILDRLELFVEQFKEAAEEFGFLDVYSSEDSSADEVCELCYACIEHPHRKKLKAELDEIEELGGERESNEEGEIDIESQKPPTPK